MRSNTRSVEDILRSSSTLYDERTVTGNASEDESNRQFVKRVKAQEAEALNFSAYKAGQENGASSVISEVGNMFANNALSVDSPQAYEYDDNTSRALDNFYNPGLLEEVEQQNFLNSQALSEEAGELERQAIIDAGGITPNISDQEFNAQDTQSLLQQLR